MDRNAAYNSHSQGYFEGLPLELMFMIFDKFDVNTFCNFAQSSHGCLEICCRYMASSFGHQFIFKTWTISDGDVKGLGKLFSLMTISLPTKKRVLYALKVLTEARCIWNDEAEVLHLRFSKFGLFFHEMVRNWPQKDQELAIAIMESKNPIKKLLHAVLNNRPGTFIEKEKDVRVYYHEMYIKYETDQNISAFWLQQLLKPLVYYMQAKLLLLLFAPLNADGNISWDCFNRSGDDVLNRPIYAEGLYQLAKLGGCIRLLTETGYFEKEDSFAVLCQLSQMPEKWEEPFIAVLLFFSGTEMIKKTVTKVFVSGVISDLPSFIATCGEILWICFQSMTVVRLWTKCMLRILKQETPVRQRAFFTLFQSFANYCIELPGEEGLPNCTIRILKTMLKIFQQHNIYRERRYPKRKKYL